MGIFSGPIGKIRLREVRKQLEMKGFRKPRKKKR